MITTYKFLYDLWFQLTRLIVSITSDDNKIKTILYKIQIESFLYFNKFSLKTNPVYGQTLNDKYKQKASTNRSPTFSWYTTYTPNQIEFNVHYDSDYLYFIVLKRIQYLWWINIQFGLQGSLN